VTLGYPFVPAYAKYGPRAGPVRAFVIHMAEGGGTVGFLSRPNIRGVSVHYVIEYTGRIVQMVPEGQATGSINPNDLRTGDDADGFYGISVAKATMGAWWRDPNAASITLEIEGYAAAGPNGPQRIALIELVDDVRSRFPKMGLLGHRDFTSRKACPGTHIPWRPLGGHGPYQEADMPGLTITDLVATPGVVTVKNIPGVQAVQVDDPSTRFGAAPGTKKDTIGRGRLVGDPLGPDSPGNDRHTVYLIGVELGVLLAGQVTFEPAPAADTPHTVVLSIDGDPAYEVTV